MMEKLRGIVRSPECPVPVEAMNDAIAAAAVAGARLAHLKLDKHHVVARCTGSSRAG